MALSPPRSLSPSKVSSFTGCPLAFRFTIIDRLPEPPSPHAIKGTLVHAALEGLFWHHPPGRRDRAAALAELESAWARLRAEDPEFTALELSEQEAEAFLSDAALLVDNYFKLEDPDRVRAVGVELGLEADIGRLRLRGIIDRLDLTDDGELIVIDYKTGKAPSLRFERTKLAGVQTYALLCERVLGRPPAEVRLLYLRDPVVLTAVPNQQSLLGQERRTLAVWSAIERACDREDFQPRPSPLCGYCSFQSLCPAFADRIPVGQAAS